MSDSDHSDCDIPDVKTCERLCQEFASVTGTDSACAQFFLQDRSWDLERSLNDYYENVYGGSTLRPSGKDGKSSEVVLVVDGSQSSLAAAASAIVSETLTVPKNEIRLATASKIVENPETLKLLSWNIDGIDRKNLKLRTEAVCKIILDEKADVVFLQELVPETASQVECALPGYKCLFGGEMEYFTGMLLKKTSIWYENHAIIPFPDTKMGRNIIAAQVKVSEKEILLMTSHFESTADHTEERKNQLKIAFKKMSNAPQTNAVLFGGDLNMRDKELDAVGGLPRGIEDLWITCGSRKECAYTWDMTRNDNLIFNGRFKPRTRFDRVYLKRNALQKNLVPKHFGLLGLERLLPHRCFPSDHWGLVCLFDISQ